MTAAPAAAEKSSRLVAGRPDLDPTPEVPGPVVTGTEVAPITLKREKIIAATWWLVWLLGTLWICHLLANAWPHVHQPEQLVLLVTLPGVVFRSIELAWMQFTGRLFVRWRRWIARLVALPCGVLLSAFLWSPLDATSMARFETAMRPLVAQVRANAANPCPPGAGYRIGADLNDYLVASGAPRAPLGIHYAGGRVVLVLVGRSIDIEGSMVFYDSASGKWEKFHSASRSAAEDLDARIKGMQQCRIPLR